MVMTEKAPLDSASGTVGGSSRPADPPDRRRDPAAERALAEARARRAEADRISQEQASQEQPKELQGRNGLDPTRYGDWEVNGITSDF
jgi:hypothetical protein